MYVCMYVCVHVVSPSSTTEYMMYSSYDKKHKERGEKRKQKKNPDARFHTSPRLTDRMARTGAMEYNAINTTRLSQEAAECMYLYNIHRSDVRENKAEQETGGTPSLPFPSTSINPSRLSSCSCSSW